MRVALIAGTYHPERCGVAHYTLHLRNTLAQRGIESQVLTTHAAARTLQDSTVLGSVTDWRLSELLPLVKAIHCTQADVLHIQHAAGTYGFDRTIFLLPLALKLSGWRSPIVTTVHEYGWWEWQPSWLPAPWVERLKLWGQQRGWWDREDGFLLTQSEAIITTNADAQTVIQKRLPHLKQRQQIPIGANIAIAPVERMSARQALQHRCGWSNDALIIAFFGFLHPVKGLETLLPAFKQVLAAVPEARLVLIGGVESLALPAEQADRYWQQLHTKIAELHLQDVVHLTGYLDPTAVSHTLRGADIGVLPFNHGVTLKSGSLLALMAHELPVVATRANPPDPELEGDRLLRSVSPRDIDGLAEALLQLLRDPGLRQQLGQAGFAFSRRFSWSSIAEAHQTIYQSLTQSSPLPSLHHPSTL